MKKWKFDIFNADVNIVDAEIQSIGEEVTPADLVEYARENPDSELHKCFEWDDKIAAEKYRLDQARKVLRFIVEVPEREEQPEVRAYMVTTERTYAPARSFLVNQDEYNALLERALGELRAFEQKYKILTELEGVFEAIDEL